MPVVLRSARAMATSVCCTRVSVSNRRLRAMSRPTAAELGGPRLAPRRQSIRPRDPVLVPSRAQARGSRAPSAGRSSRAPWWTNRIPRSRVLFGSPGRSWSPSTSTLHSPSSSGRGSRRGSWRTSTFPNRCARECVGPFRRRARHRTDRGPCSRRTSCYFDAISTAALPGIASRPIADRLAPPASIS